METPKNLDLSLSRLQAYGLWAVIILAAGFFFGTQYCNQQVGDRVVEAVKLGSFYYEGKVYDIKPRVIYKQDEVVMQEAQ